MDLQCRYEEGVFWSTLVKLWFCNCSPKFCILPSTCVRESHLLRMREETLYCTGERERCDELSVSKSGKVLLYLCTSDDN